MRLLVIGTQYCNTCMIIIHFLHHFLSDILYYIIFLLQKYTYTHSLLYSHILYISYIYTKHFFSSSSTSLLYYHLFAFDSHEKFCFVLLFSFSLNKRSFSFYIVSKFFSPFAPSLYCLMSRNFFLYYFFLFVLINFFLFSL